jgi:hypothetical protein
MIPDSVPISSDIRGLSDPETPAAVETAGTVERVIFDAGSGAASDPNLVRCVASNVIT